VTKRIVLRVTRLGQIADSDYEQDKELTLDGAVGSLQQQVHDFQLTLSF
jgi:hypothetical protein